MISIIVPVYNVEKFLSTTVRSVLQQEDFDDWELVLVDDGSKDNSSVLCDKLATIDIRIKVIHKANGGLSSARNAGIEISTGDYLLFLDGDDCLDSSTLKLLHQAASDHPGCDFIQFRYEEVLPTAPLGHKVSNQIENYTELYNEEDFFQQLYNWGGVAASACTKLIKRSTLGDLRFKEGIIHEDEQFITRLLSRCQQIGYCTNECYKYVIRSGSIQHSTFSLNRLDAISIMDERIHYLQTRGYDYLVCLFQDRLFSNLLLMWSNAYEAKNIEALAIIEQHITRLCKHGNTYKSGIESKIVHFFGKRVLEPLYHIRKILKPIIQKTRIAFLNWNDKRIKSIRRKKLSSSKFTIISNNCWGEHVYQYFGLPYTSPTVGLSIMDDDYIKFLERLDYYLAQPLHFIPIEQSRYYKQIQQECPSIKIYPLALLDDIEIHFLHYSSEEEARMKWEYRKVRINKDKLLIKMSLRSVNDCSFLDRFAALPFKNKICFTEYEYIGVDYVHVPELKNLNILEGDETPYLQGRLDLIELINKIDILYNVENKIDNNDFQLCAWMPKWMSVFLNYRMYLIRCKVKQYRIRNKQFTLITDNCLAGNVYHDLNIPFQSPFINGGCDCKDYLRLLSNLEHYLHSKIMFESHSNYDFPYARIDDIHYRFRHYSSESQVIRDWNRRLQRVNLNKLFIVLTEKEDCTYDLMLRFDKLPFRNKIILTHIPYPQLKSARYIPGFEKEYCCRVLSEYISGQCFGKRYYDGFDFVDWINSESIEKQ